MSCTNNRGSGEWSSAGKYTQNHSCMLPVKHSYHACVVPVTCSSGMQQIYDQIRERLEEKQVQAEMKEQEKQQIRGNREKMDLEDLKVQP